MARPFDLVGVGLNATDTAARLGFSLAAGAADELGLQIPFFALRAALRGPFAGLTAEHPGGDLPDDAAWWITQVRAHLERPHPQVPAPGLAPCSSIPAGEAPAPLDSFLSTPSYPPPRGP